MKRRDFLRFTTGALSAGAFGHFIPGISSASSPMIIDPRQKKRLVIMFSPNGMVRDGFWPETDGQEFEMTPVLKPLEPFRDKTLVVHGICNKIRGDGDNHMRGISALLTSNELFPGNIVGGSDTAAGWSKGISIDQEIKNFLQSNKATRTRFGSLEFGVRVPYEADPWTRMVFAGPNQPVAPIDDPYAMYSKLYGKIEERDNLLKVLNLLEKDFRGKPKRFHPDDQQRLDKNAQRVQKMGSDLASDTTEFNVAPVELSLDVANTNDNMPELAKMQMDLLVNSFENDLNRIATLQFTKSVSNEKMKWLDVEEGHHSLSHLPDKDKAAQEKLTRINIWYAQQLAYLIKKLSETKEPGTDQPMIDNTLVLWTNELGHGNSHSLNNLPFVMIGGGFGFEMGKYTKVDRVSTDRVWLAIANAMGHNIETFGLPSLPKDGPIKF